MRSILILAALSLTTGCASIPRKQDQDDKPDLSRGERFANWCSETISTNFNDWLTGRISGTDYRTDAQKAIDDEQFDKMTKLPPDPNAIRGSSGAGPWGR